MELHKNQGQLNFIETLTRVRVNYLGLPDADRNSSQHPGNVIHWTKQKIEDSHETYQSEGRQSMWAAKKKLAAWIQ